MRKTRRIEITAFRRSRRLSVDVRDARPTDRAAQVQNGGLSSAGDHSVQGQQSSLLELMQLIESVVASQRDGARAAQPVAVSRTRLPSRLRTLGSSIRNLL